MEEAACQRRTGECQGSQCHASRQAQAEGCVRAAFGLFPAPDVGRADAEVAKGVQVVDGNQTKGKQAKIFGKQQPGQDHIGCHHQQLGSHEGGVSP